VFKFLSAALALVGAGSGITDRRPPVDAPPPITASLIAIERPLGFAGECIELHPRLKLQARYDAIEDKYVSAVNQAIGLWGPAVQPPPEALRERPWSSCKHTYVITALRRAERALAIHATLFREATATMNNGGIWFGPLKLCRAVVADAKLTREPSDYLALVIKLTGDTAPTLAMLTERSIGHPLAVRLNGKVIAQPIVDEPLERGELQLSGPDRQTLEQIQTALAASC
jgi:hypothetical protein